MTTRTATRPTPRKKAASTPPGQVAVGRSKSVGKVIGYRRVSTLDQSTARQLEGIELDRVF